MCSNSLDAAALDAICIGFGQTVSWEDNANAKSKNHLLTFREALHTTASNLVYNSVFPDWVKSLHPGLRKVLLAKNELEVSDIGIWNAWNLYRWPLCMGYSSICGRWSGIVSPPTCEINMIYSVAWFMLTRRNWGVRVFQKKNWWVCVLSLSFYLNAQCSRILQEISLYFWLLDMRYASCGLLT